jgi:putative endonuclease
MPDPRHLLGRRGEEMASAWLTARGWAIIARRWRCPAGELDLVAIDPGGTLVGVEVKLRGGMRAGRPIEAVDGRRLLRLRRALAQFAATSGQPRGEGLRIDLIAVSGEPGGGWRLAHHRAIDAW